MIPFESNIQKEIPFEYYQSSVDSPEKQPIYTPREIAHLYGIPSHINCDKQCIGIIALGGGYHTADLHAYFTHINSVYPQIIVQSVDGVRNQPTDDMNGPDGEILMDIIIAASMAPGAKIIVYFAPNTTAGFLNAVTTAVYDRQYSPSVLSISWGKPECHWSLPAMYMLNRILHDATKRGITVCCAAGDKGSSNGISDGLTHVSFPASSPYVLACGGTRIESIGNHITKEVVWNDGKGNATGGGISSVFDMPSWQSSFPIPKKSNLNQKQGRGIPDVAGHADPDIGYKIQLDNKTMINGGTSAVAPLWAGLITIINQQLGQSVGFINPVLYDVSLKKKIFRDITEGHNHSTDTRGVYYAQKGWNACTGLGSPYADILIQEVCEFYRSDAKCKSVKKEMYIN